MEDRVKKSLWIITVIAALLIPIICFNVTVGRAENVRFIIPEALKELIEKRDANFLIVDTQPKAAYKLRSSISPGKSELWIWLGLRLGCARWQFHSCARTHHDAPSWLRITWALGIQKKI
jgi:hypothetical protein